MGALCTQSLEIASSCEIVRFWGRDLCNILPTMESTMSTTILQRDQVIAAHRAEGEPREMSRVRSMLEERWPGRSASAWIAEAAAEPRRYVAVTFARDCVRGAGTTWLEAMDALDAERQRRWIGY